jgi:hypothetical protein
MGRYLASRWSDSICSNANVTSDAVESGICQGCGVSVTITEAPGSSTRSGGKAIGVSSRPNASVP